MYIYTWLYIQLPNQSHQQHKAWNYAEKSKL